MDTTKLKNILQVLSNLEDNFTCSLVLTSGGTDIVLTGEASSPDAREQFQQALSRAAHRYIETLKAELATELSKPQVAQRLHEILTTETV